MKKTYFIIVGIIIIHISLFAQQNSNTWYIGGQANFYGNTNDILDTLYSSTTQSQTSMIIPNVGYFIAENLSVGINIKYGIAHAVQTQNYTLTNSNKINTYTCHTTSYGGGLFIRKQIELHEKFYLFVQGELNYMYQFQKNTKESTDTKVVYPTSDPAYQELTTHIVNITLFPGFVYKVSPKLGIQSSIGNIFFNNSIIENQSLLYDNHNKTSNYGISLNMDSFYLGLAYYF